MSDKFEADLRNESPLIFNHFVILSDFVFRSPNSDILLNMFKINDKAALYFAFTVYRHHEELKWGTRK